MVGYSIVRLVRTEFRVLGRRASLRLFVWRRCYHARRHAALITRQSRLLQRTQRPSPHALITFWCFFVAFGLARSCRPAAPSISFRTLLSTSLIQSNTCIYIYIYIYIHPEDSPIRLIEMRNLDINFYSIRFSIETTIDKQIMQTE